MAQRLGKNGKKLSKRTSWIDTQEQIIKHKDLNGKDREKIKARYFKHQKAIVEKVNSIFLEKYKKSYPNNELQIQKYGKNKYGFQYWYSFKKKKKVLATKGSIFDKTYIPLWKHFALIDLITKQTSIRLISFMLGLSVPTVFKYKHEYLNLFDDASTNTDIKGEVILDEIYFEDKSNHTDKKLRGLSENKLCVYTGCNSNGRKIFAKVLGKGKPDNERTKEIIDYSLCMDHIKKVQTDGDKTYKSVIELNYTKVKVISEKKNPALAWINSVHAKLRSFFNKTWGIATKYFQKYLNLAVYLFNTTYLSPERKHKYIFKKFYEEKLKY